MKRYNWMMAGWFCMFLLLGMGCAQADVEKEAPETERQTLNVADYYTDVPSVVTEYAVLSVELTENCHCLPQDGITDEYLYRYDLIMQEDNIGYHTSNGIIRTDKQGRRERICPEPNCTADQICHHIFLWGEGILIPHGTDLYICGTPWLAGETYENTCVMRYDLNTREYVKYAEIPHSISTAFVSGSYLFLGCLTAEEVATLYCFDLTEDLGYRHIFYAKDGAPDYQGVLDGRMIVSDTKNLYFLDGKGDIVQTYETGGRITPKIEDGVLYYELWRDNKRALYRYDSENNSGTCLIEDVNGFEIFHDTVYFFRDEEVLGLKFNSPYEGADGRIAWREEDYPLHWGTALYTYSLKTGEIGTCIQFREDQFTDGWLYISSFGLLYEYFSPTEKPQKHFPLTRVLRDLTAGEEVVLPVRWNSSGRAYY